MCLANMVGRKPHIVIIGAGMAGLSAAHQLLQFGASSLDLTVLEASNRIGGRILTSEIGGDRVELGATWIHGIEGSPLFRIAESIGVMQRSAPFERQDGLLPHAPVVVAEGGLIVPPSIFTPVMDFYKSLLLQVRSHEKLKATQKVQSIGAFVAHGFDAFLSQQNDASQSEDLLFDCLSNDGVVGVPYYTPPWTARSLQEALISMNEYMERVETSANTLYDLDMHAEREYIDYPGEHVTIPGGYMSIINALAASMPAQLIHLGKMVDKIEWNRPQQCFGSPVVVHCGDGSCYEADHVIVTMSLGVLKASIKPVHMYPWASPEGRPVCRSVDDLQFGLAKQRVRDSTLFEPPLPPCKVEAISRLGYGLVNKLFLQVNTSTVSLSQLRQLNSHIQLVYKNRSMESEGQESIPRWMRKTFSMCPIYSGSNVLLCWFAGKEALEVESLSDEEIMMGVARTLASFGVARRGSGVKSRSRRSRHTEFSSNSDSEDSMSRGESHSSSNSSDSEENYDEDEGDVCTTDDFHSMFSGVLRSKWGNNPLFRGSYSFVATGASGEDIEKLAEPLPAVITRSDECKDKIATTIPNGRCIDIDTCCRPEVPGDDPPLQLLFAGEATVRNLYSTTHGAYLSGLREAIRLLNHYSLNLSAPL